MPFPSLVGLVPPYDVFNVDPLVLLAQGPKVVAAIKRATVAYKNNKDFGARVLITVSQGCRDSPVAVIVGKGFDPSQDIKLQLHFHGINATICDRVGDGGLSGTIVDMQLQDPQHVVALVEDKNPIFAPPDPPMSKTPDQGRDWSHVTDLTAVQDDVQNGVGAASVGSYIVSAHSGGGVALASVMAKDLATTSNRKFRCDELRLLDCLSIGQGDPLIEAGIARWAKAHPGEIASVVMVLATMTAPSAWSQVQTAFTAGGTSCKEITLVRPSSPNFVDEPSPLPVDPDPTNSLVARWRFDGFRQHTRARGQFLGFNA